MVQKAEYRAIVDRIHDLPLPLLHPSLQALGPSRRGLHPSPVVFQLRRLRVQIPDTERIQPTQLDRTETSVSHPIVGRKPRRRIDPPHRVRRGAVNEITIAFPRPSDLDQPIARGKRHRAPGKESPDRRHQEQAWLGTLQPSTHPRAGEQIRRVRQQNRIVLQNQGEIVPTAQKLLVRAHVAHRAPQLTRSQDPPIALHGACIVRHQGTLILRQSAATHRLDDVRVEAQRDQMGKYPLPTLDGLGQVDDEDAETQSWSPAECATPKCFTVSLSLQISTMRAPAAELPVRAGEPTENGHRCGSL